MSEEMCEWCGHDHPRTTLCSKRPRWSRRGFLYLAGLAALGAMAPAYRDTVPVILSPGEIVLDPEKYIHGILRFEEVSFPIRFRNEGSVFALLREDLAAPFYIELSNE